MKRKQIVIAALSVFLGGAWAMAQSSHWLHVKVEKLGSDEEQVKVNVPLGLVETVLPMIEEKELAKGKIRLEELPFSVQQMREIWASLKAEGDFELASIQDADMNLRIFKEGEYLYIRSSEESEEQILVTLPAPVVDALLSGEGDELDLMAAAQALTASGDGELVRVKDGDETVRVWIDTTSRSE